MTISTLLIIATVVAATGALWSQLFRTAGSPYLFTIRGSLPHLILGAVGIWGAALGLGILVLGVVSLIMPSVVALAIFFGVEAVALDICAHRTRYVREQPKSSLSPLAQPVSVRRPF